MSNVYSPATLTDDDPIPLADAAKLFFGGRLTKSALRTEAKLLEEVAMTQELDKEALLAAIDKRNDGFSFTRDIILAYLNHPNVAGDAERIKALEAAMTPFAKEADGWSDTDDDGNYLDPADDDRFPHSQSNITVGHLRTARALLSKEASE